MRISMNYCLKIDDMREFNSAFWPMHLIKSRYEALKELLVVIQSKSSPSEILCWYWRNLQQLSIPSSATNLEHFPLLKANTFQKKEPPGAQKFQLFFFQDFKRQRKKPRALEVQFSSFLPSALFKTRGLEWLAEVWVLQENKLFW